MKDLQIAVIYFIGAVILFAAAMLLV